MFVQPRIRSCGDNSDFWDGILWLLLSFGQVHYHQMAKLQDVNDVDDGISGPRSQVREMVEPGGRRLVRWQIVVPTRPSTNSLKFATSSQF